MKITEEDLTNAAIGLESIQPISETDGFIECLYSDPDFITIKGFIEFSFYIHDYINDEKYELFFDFLEKEKINDSKVIFANNKIEILINIPDKNIKKYAIIGKAKKYNISL
jgi:hypothetical protein